MSQDSPLGDLCALVHLHRTDHRHHHQGRWGFLGWICRKRTRILRLSVARISPSSMARASTSNLDLPSGISDQR